MKRPLVIYVPGLGDIYDGGRRLALKFWWLWGVEAELVPMHWYDGQALDAKLSRLNQAIDQAVSKNRQVYLIGESAGASLTILALAGRQDVAGLLTLCGVDSPDAPIAPYLRRRAPAFDQAVGQLSVGLKELDRQRVITVSAWWDPSVARRFSTLAGVKNYHLPSIGHLITIALGLTLYGGFLVSRLRKTKVI